MVGLEWLGPIFSGNGVYSRALTEGLVAQRACVAAVSALTDQSPGAVATQAGSDPAVGALAGGKRCAGDPDGTYCGTNNESMAIGVPVDASTWRRLGLDGPWKAFARGLEHGTRAFDALVAFRPQVVVAVDWHGALAYEAFAAGWATMCAPDAGSDRPAVCKQRGGSPPPMVYMSFRLFSGSAGLTATDEATLALGLAEARASASAVRTVALSRVDAARLRRLAADLGTADGMPWASGPWWRDVDGWAGRAMAGTPAAPARGPALVASVRRAVQLRTSAEEAAADARWSVLLPPLRSAVRARALLDPEGVAAGIVKDRSPYAPDGVGGGDGGGRFQHDQLPWVELFDRWLVDDSARAAMEDTDAWLASHEAAIAFKEGEIATRGMPADEPRLVEPSGRKTNPLRVQRTPMEDEEDEGDEDGYGEEDGEDGEGGGGDASPAAAEARAEREREEEETVRRQLEEDRRRAEAINAEMDEQDRDHGVAGQDEEVPDDSLVQLGSPPRARPHSFRRPPLLRHVVELHPVHPTRREAHRSYTAFARGGDKGGGAGGGVSVLSDSEDEPTTQAEAEAAQDDSTDSQGRPMFKAGDVSMDQMVDWLYGNATEETLPLLPPRWLADVGYPLEETLPDKALVTVRSVRQGFGSMQRDEAEVEVRGGARPADTERGRRLRAAQAKSRELARPRESVMLPVRRLLLWCGRVSPEKRPLFFPRALLTITDLIEQTGTVPAACVSGPNETLNGQVERLMAMTHPNAVVIGSFLSPARLADLFTRTVLHVHTADYEAYGMTPVEAAAFGTPTLAHAPGCGGGDVCTSERPGARPLPYNASRPVESLQRCGERVAPYRRGEVHILQRVLSRAQDLNDKDGDSLAERAGRAVEEVSRNTSAHRGRTKALTSPRGFVASAAGPRARAAPRTRSGAAFESAPAPAVGSLELLRPDLGLAYGTNMSAEPWHLGLAIARIICTVAQRLPWSEAGMQRPNLQDKHATLFDTPWRPAPTVPGLASWSNAEISRQSRSLDLLEARTGSSRDRAERMLRCRAGLRRGFDGALTFERHIQNCGCLGFAGEHAAHAQPIGRGERIAAGIRSHRPREEIEAQDEQAEADGFLPHGPIPHPGCVGLAARRAALSWTGADATGALAKALVSAAKTKRPSQAA